MAWLSNVARGLFLPFSTGQGIVPIEPSYGRCAMTYEVLCGVAFGFASADLGYSVLDTERLKSM